MFKLRSISHLAKYVTTKTGVCKNESLEMYNISHLWSSNIKSTARAHQMSTTLRRRLGFAKDSEGFVHGEFEGYSDTAGTPRMVYFKCVAQSVFYRHTAQKMRFQLPIVYYSSASEHARRLLPPHPQCPSYLQNSGYVLLISSAQFC